MAMNSTVADSTLFAPISSSPKTGDQITIYPYFDSQGFQAVIVDVIDPHHVKVQWCLDDNTFEALIHV